MFFDFFIKRSQLGGTNLPGAIKCYFLYNLGIYTVEITEPNDLKR